MVGLRPFSRERNRPIVRVRNPDNHVRKPGETTGFTSTPPRLCNIEYYEEQNKTNKITSKNAGFYHGNDLFTKNPGPFRLSQIEKLFLMSPVASTSV